MPYRVKLHSAALSGICLLVMACSGEDEPAGDVEPGPTPSEANDLAAKVTAMASIGYSGGARFAPDGKRIAFLSNASGSPNIWMADIEGGEPRQVTDLEDQVRQVEWSPVDELFAVEIAPGGGLNTQIYLMSSSGEDARMITQGGQVGNNLVGFSDDGRYISYSSNAENPGRLDCWLHDLETGESRLIAVNNGIGYCDLSPDNRYAIAWRMVSRGDSNLYLIDLESGEEQLVTPHEGVATSAGSTFLSDNSFVFATNVDREMTALARVDIIDGVVQPLEYVAGRDDAELADGELLADGRLLLNWNASGRSELAIYDPSTGEMSPGPALPAELANGFEASPVSSDVLMSVSGSAAVSNVWNLDVSTNAFTRISDTPHDGVDLDALVRPQLRTYTAHDGLELSGWLYEAPDQEEPGAMVLSFHGGPEGQTRPVFRADFQALLSRGISVFAPNVRGSSGFGKTFVNLDNGALRFDGIKDIESTVRFVVDEGLADPERIGIMGGSYGGYMVMAGITEYPEMFAAGANLFGMVNFETFFEHTEPWMAAISTVEYGDPATERDLLRKLSPIHKIDRIVTPTIVLHGANDTNVPVIEAEQVVENLQAREVPVDYVLFPDEGHGWGKVKNRVTSTVEITRWFESYLK